MSRRKNPLRHNNWPFSVSAYGWIDRGKYAEDSPMWGVDRAVGRRVLDTMALLLLALGAVACVGGSGTSSDTVRSTEHSTVSTSTTSARSSTTTTPTSSSTSATSHPVASVEDSIRGAVAWQQTFSDCLIVMPKCDPTTLSAARAGPLLERNVARIQEWNAAGYTVRNRDQFRYVVESVVLKPDGVSVSAVVCIADGSDLVYPGAGPGGADVIIDDAYTSGGALPGTCDSIPTGSGAYDAPAVGPTESSDLCPAD